MNQIEDENLSSLSTHLAEVIQDSLIRFKENVPNQSIIYSKDWEEEEYVPVENLSNDTEWFLDELIWTFGYLKNGGENSESVQISKRIAESIPQLEFKNNELPDVGEMRKYSEEFQNHPDFMLYQETRRREMGRMQEGLRLFGKHFQALWY
jgi:hypothetical protein